MRGILVVATSCVAMLALALGGCGKTRSCAANTVLLHVEGDAADAADTLALDITTSTGSSKMVSVAWKASGGSVEIDFPHGYPHGQTITITATATKAGLALASGVASVPLSAACESVSIELTSVNGMDQSVATDGSVGGDMCVPSVTSCPAGACGQVDDGCGAMIACATSCQVNRADRVVASAGDTITLEGRFSGPTVVTFPGGATVTAMVLGANRASVKVPATAGEGALSVSSGGSEAGSLPFRRSPYTIGVQPFRGYYEQVDYAHQLAPLQQTRYWTTAVAGDQYVYVIGGEGNGPSTTPGTVELARINADGSLGGFTTSPSHLVAPRGYTAAIILGGYLYVIGGNDGDDQGTSTSSIRNTVERAHIKADGTLDTFAIVPGVTLKASLQLASQTFAGLWGHSLAVIGDWLYVFGGNLGTFCAPMPTDQIERAPINPDGTLGDFAVAPTSLFSAEAFGPAVVNGGYVYVIGAGQKVQYSPITPTGDLTGFADAGVTMPTGAGPGGAAYALANQLYVMGSSGFSGGITAMPFNADGTLGTPVVSSSTMSPTGLNANFGSAIIGHYIYAFGGGDSSECSSTSISYNTLVQRASLDASGNLGSFSSVAAVNPSTPRDGAQVVVSGDNVYLVGGTSVAGKPDVDVATVQADGTLGNFTASSLTMVTHRRGATVAAIGNDVYVLGGIDLASGTVSALDVEVAPINPDGTLGAFAVAKANGTGASVTIPIGRSGAAAFVVPAQKDMPGAVHDTLCLAGGTGSTEVDCVSINGDGTLAGSLSPITGTMVAVRQNAMSAYVGDRVYAMAGNPPGGTNTIEGAPYSGAGQLSGFSSSVTLGSQEGGRFGWSFGSIVYMAGGSNPNLGEWAQDIETSALATNGAPAAFTTSAIVVGLKRANSRAIVIGAKVYVIGGDSQLGSVDTEVAELR